VRCPPRGRAVSLLSLHELKRSDRMLSKLKRPYDPEALPPTKRLKANLQDVLAGNQLPATRTQELINDMVDAGLPSMAGLKKPMGSNVARNLRRAFLKHAQWPKPYWAEIRVRNTRANSEELQVCCFMLPHEYVYVLNKVGLPSVLLSTEGLDPLSKEHLERCEVKAGAQLLPLGIWGDGIPVNYDRTESVETFSVNLPGQAGEFSTLRLPLTGLCRRQISEHTWEDICEIFRWSLLQCALGSWPQARHDGSAWCSTDAQRARWARQIPPTIQAALVEIRGDWKFFGELFAFPKWNTKSGICWKCHCRPEQVPFN
jgi:hypothetical protein